MRFILAPLLRLLASRLRSNADPEIQLLVARQQLAIYQRSVARPRERRRRRRPWSARRARATGMGGPSDGRCRTAGRWTLKTWKRIAEKAKELPPERQREILNYVEFLRSQDGSAPPPRTFDSPDDLPGNAAGGDEQSNSWDAVRPSGFDGFHVRPPRRHGGQIAIGIVFALVVVAVGGYLYYRFGRPSGGTGDTAGREPDALPAPVAVAEPEPEPRDAGAALPAADGPGDAAAPDATLSLALGSPTGESPDAGTGTAEPAGTDAAPGIDGWAAAPAVFGCDDALGEARDLWRKRDREGALQKLRDAIACDPSAVEPRIQWGRWVLETPALQRDRDLCAEGAATFRPAAEANPDHGELWFHYTNLLFGSGQRDAARAAKEHCTAIRPRDDYSSSCRFLPQ